MVKIGVAYIYGCYRKTKTRILRFGPPDIVLLLIHSAFIETCVESCYGLVADVLRGNYGETGGMDFGLITAAPS